MARYAEWNKFIGNLKTDKYGNTTVNEVGIAFEKATSDVVPKSEVERLKRAYEGSQKTIKGLTEMIREKNKELAKLETHLELHHGERSLNNLIAKEKSEVALEILEEIERLSKILQNDYRRDNSETAELVEHATDYFLYELKKNYTEGKT